MLKKNIELMMIIIIEKIAVVEVDNKRVMIVIMINSLLSVDLVLEIN